MKGPYHCIPRNRNDPEEMFFGRVSAGFPGNDVWAARLNEAYNRGILSLTAKVAALENEILVLEEALQKAVEEASVAKYALEAQTKHDIEEEADDDDLMTDEELDEMLDDLENEDIRDKF